MSDEFHNDLAVEKRDEWHDADGDYCPECGMPWDCCTDDEEEEL